VYTHLGPDDGFILKSKLIDVCHFNTTTYSCTNTN